MAVEDFIRTKNERLNKQLLFTVEIDKMTAILRHTVLIDKSRCENDAEHSWHIAVMALLFSEYAAEPVNVARAVEMCVVHDLVEIEAGDTFAFDEAANVGKEEREKEAADRLFAKLPNDQAKTIRGLWEEFDAMNTPDAKFASCMDRLQPFIHNALTDGHTWPGVRRSAVEKRLEIVRSFMPEVYAWVAASMDLAVSRGWLEK